MIIKLDIDGVLRDMETPMVDLYNKRFGTNMKIEDIVSYDVNKSFPLFKENGIDGFKYFFVDHLKECYVDAAMYDRANEAVQMLRLAGHVVHIVSYQPSLEAQKATLDWLDKHGIYFDDITFTNTKDKICVPCDMIIDDCPDYIDPEPANVVRICINHSYNKDCKAFHFNTLYEFADFITEFGLELVGVSN